MEQGLRRAPPRPTTRAAALAVDAAGNILVAGQFEGTIDFGVGPLTSLKTDGFVAKLSPTGDGLWSKRFGEVKSQDLASGIAVDASGTVIVTGIFEGTVDFGGGAIHGGRHELFLLALDPGRQPPGARESGSPRARRASRSIRRGGC